MVTLREIRAGAGRGGLALPPRTAEDVFCGARGGRDVGDGGQLGRQLTGLAQVSQSSGQPDNAAPSRSAPGKDRERRPARGRQQSGLRVARVRSAPVERLEIGRGDDREFLALPRAEPDCALRADLLRRLPERDHGHGPGIAGDDPRRVRVLPPVQLCVLRVQVLLAAPAVGDPRGATGP